MCVFICVDSALLLGQCCRVFGLHVGPVVCVFLYRLLRCTYDVVVLKRAMSRMFTTGTLLRGAVMLHMKGVSNGILVRPV